MYRYTWWYHSAAACVSEGTVATLCSLQPDEADGGGTAGEGCVIHYNLPVTVITVDRDVVRQLCYQC